MVTMEELLVRLPVLRESYAYPPGRLVPDNDNCEDVVIVGEVRLKMDVPTTAQWQQESVRSRYSSVAVDRYHAQLLLSDHAGERLHGLLSVIAWGYVSGTDSRIRSGRAMGKTRIVIQALAPRFRRNCHLLINSSTRRARLRRPAILPPRWLRQRRSSSWDCRLPASW